MIAHGLQRLDGRSWRSDYRGPLWIHAAAKEPTPEEIADMEAFHTDIFQSLTLDAGGDEGTSPTLPSSYPTSCLLGCVDMVDCVSAAVYSSWPLLPDGAREEASIHGTANYFLFEKHRRLVLPQRMGGQHKLWNLDGQLARALWESSGLRPSAQAPVSWVGHREAADAAKATDSAQLAAPTAAMRRNARRTAARQAKQMALSDGTESTEGRLSMARAPPPAPAVPASSKASEAHPIVRRYFRKDGTLAIASFESESLVTDIGGHMASASSAAVAEYQARLAASALARSGCDASAVAHRLTRSLDWARQWTQTDEEKVPRPRSVPEWLPTACFRDVELRRRYLPAHESEGLLQALLSQSVSREREGAPTFWQPALYLNRSRETGALEVAVDEAGEPLVANSRLQASYEGGLRALDAVIARIMIEWRIVGDGSRVLLNRYDSGDASIATHRQDFWSVLLSLGHERVLLLDDQPLLLRAGDVLVMGTQKHGVPRQPDCQGPRCSVALFFPPPDGDLDRQRWLASTGLASAVGAPGGAFADGATSSDEPGRGRERAVPGSEGMVGRAHAALDDAERRLAALRSCARMLPYADLTAALADAAAQLEEARTAATAATAAKARAVQDRKRREVEALAARQGRGEQLDANQLAKLHGAAPGRSPGLAVNMAVKGTREAKAADEAPVDASRFVNAADEDPMDAWMLAHALAISTAQDDASTAARQQALELAAAVEDRATASTGDDPNHESIDAVADQHDNILDEGDWSSRVANLTRMGFERARAAEMLALCEGDVAQAVSLLCS